MARKGGRKAVISIKMHLAAFWNGRRHIHFAFSSGIGHSRLGTVILQRSILVLRLAEKFHKIRRPNAQRAL
jgi:hypothetical protein